MYDYLFNFDLWTKISDNEYHTTPLNLKVIIGEDGKFELRGISENDLVLESYDFGEIQAAIVKDTCIGGM